MHIRKGWSCILAPLLSAVCGLAHAQIPVTDVGAIVQLVSQLQVLEQQVETARRQLEQAQSEYLAITGDRGMEQLLRGTVRNYLPATWADMQTVLATSIHNTEVANAVLSDVQLGALWSQDRQTLVASRTTAALRQILTQQALATTSERFAALQHLIDAIPNATDQKGVLDLLARVAAEQSMLQNEQTKLQLIARASQADADTIRLRAQEQAIAGQGSFATRFQPTP